MNAWLIYHESQSEHGAKPALLLGRLLSHKTRPELGPLLAERKLDQVHFWRSENWTGSTICPYSLLSDKNGCGASISFILMLSVAKHSCSIRVEISAPFLQQAYKSLQQ